MSTHYSCEIFHGLAACKPVTRVIHLDFIWLYSVNYFLRWYTLPSNFHETVCVWTIYIIHVIWSQKLVWVSWLALWLKYDCLIVSKETLDFYPLSVKSSYRQISWRLKAAKLYIIMFVSFWNVTGFLTALLSRRLPRAIRKVQTKILRFRDFIRS